MNLSGGISPAITKRDFITSLWLRQNRQPNLIVLGRYHSAGCFCTLVKTNWLGERICDLLYRSQTFLQGL